MIDVIFITYGTVKIIKNSNQKNQTDKSGENYMEEIEKVKSVYKISKSDTAYTIESKDNFNFYQEGIIWSESDQSWIIAVQRYYKNGVYCVEYIFLSEDFEIKSVYRETDGVNPVFIVGINKEIWVRLSATKECYPMNTDVTLPMFERSRIEKPIVKRDTGMDSFLLDGQTYGFIRDDWGEGKESKLVIHQYDKMGLYKNRKTKKLTGIYGGLVTVVRGKAYLYHTALYEISKKGELIFIDRFDEEKNCLSLLIDIDENEYTFIHRDETEKCMELVRYSSEGKQIEKRVIYKGEKRILWVEVKSIYDRSQMITFFANGVVTMGYKDGEFCICKGCVGECTEIIKYGWMLSDKAQNKGKKIYILKMDNI